MVAYLKAKLVTDIPDAGIIKHLEWNSVPERANELLEIVKSNKDVMQNISEIKKMRLNLIEDIEKLLKVIE